MSETNHVRIWSSEGWQAEATAWMDARLDEAGIPRTGSVDQPRVRPWGAVLRAPTTGGMVWLKAAAPATAFEVPLYTILHAHAAELVLEPIAMDTARGWLLLPDGGVHLGDVLDGEALIAAMATVLPRYAELQRSLASAVEAMLAVGVLDVRPHTLVDRFDEAVAFTGAYATEHGSDEDRALHLRITAARPRVAAWADALTGSPVPVSIDHDDLHPRNVLVRSAEAIASARVYDWGDSVVAHPFTTALVALRAIQATLKVGPNDPALTRLRDAYLEPFGDLGSRGELVETLDAACQSGKLARALVWHRALAMMPHEEAGELADAPLYWLGEILEPSPLGGLEF